jgi:hypothetical protein
MGNIRQIWTMAKRSDPVEVLTGAVREKTRAGLASGPCW